MSVWKKSVGRVMCVGSQTAVSVIRGWSDIGVLTRAVKTSSSPSHEKLKKHSNRKATNRLLFRATDLQNSDLTYGRVRPGMNEGPCKLRTEMWAMLGLSLL